MTKEMDTVIFDIGNVLIHFDWMGYLKSLKFDEETYEHVANAMFRNENWNAGDSGLVTTEEWLRLFIDNDRAYEAQIRKTFDGFGASIVPYEFTESWIQYFREREMKIYYLSNYSEEMYRQSKERLSFLNQFDGGVFSWKEKCMKPDKDIYEILLSRYEIDPKHALFFDDREENVEAAAKLGIRGVVFRPEIARQMLEDAGRD